MKALVRPCNRPITQSKPSVDSNEAKIEAILSLTQQLPPSIVPRLFACGRVVHVISAPEGAILTVKSDAHDGKQLSDPERIFTFDGFLTCYRGLRAGEFITVTASGCGNVSIDSRSEQVVAPPTVLPPPVVRSPVRVFDRGTTIDKIVPGARVYVFVNGLWRAFADSAAQNFPLIDSVFVFLGTLKLEDEITALQVLCEKTSLTSSPGVPVTLGRLSVHHDPSPLVRAGPNKQTLFAIRVQDAVTAFQIPSARLFINNVEFPIDRQLGITILPGQDGPPTVVRAEGYADERLVYNLVDPTVPQPAFLTLDLSGGDPGTSIDKVTWDVYSTSGLGNTQRAKVSTATGPTTQVKLPPPAGQNTEYLVECSADVTFPNIGKLTVKIDSTSNGFANSAVIGWVGQNLAAHFHLEADLITDPNTGQVAVYRYIKLTGTTP
jgi:hypothetical protein